MREANELPIPTPNADTAPYWAAAREGKLLLQRCTACGAVRFPPSHLCPRCGSDEAAWVEASGRGTVHSFTIVHRAPSPAFRARVPYVIVLVDLAEGPRMMANLLGKDATRVAIGDAVEVAFEPRGSDGAMLPQFRRSKG